MTEVDYVRDVTIVDVRYRRPVPKATSREPGLRSPYAMSTVPEAYPAGRVAR